MTDASPINSYLLFNSPNEFRSINQVELALSRRKNDFSESKLDKHILIRSLDDLKRYLLYNERSSITPSTTATFTSEITADRPVSPNMDLLLNSHEADHDHDAKPWDNIGDLIDQWNWPIESLYQTYHLVIVLDLSKKTFCVSRNGSVFFDRVPSVMEALLLVLKTIFACRDEEVALIKQWLYNHKFEEECLADILQRIWFPTVYVSILLVNAPQVKKKSNVSVNGGAVPLLPPDVSPLSSFCHTSTEPSVVPLLTRCDARDLIEDNTFIERLQSVLFSYESVCRECEPGEWREFPLEVCLEFIVNSSPEFSSECFSYMFLANLSGASFSSRLSFLDSTVRRKGIILSLISLNRLVAFDSPQLSSLTQFLSSVGGFVTNIDYYLSLCTSRLNADWGKRFEGARCLAQQIFVHLINRFPVASSLSQQRAIFDTDAASPLYDDEMQCKSEWKEYKKNLLKAVGVLRYNEGWSVQLDYKDEASPAHLLARTVHYFHRGTIYIYYEMNISASSIYRRIFVSGTKTLVNHFCSIKTSSLVGDYLKEFTGSWVSFFFHLRYQVHQWFTSEEVLLQMLSSRDGHLPTGAADKVSLFTSPDRIDYEWLNMCTVSSIAVYFQYSPLPCSTLESVIRAPRSMASHTFSVSGACKNIISRAMSKAYVMIGNDDLCFFSPSTMYTPPYVIQFFSLKEASSDTTVCQVAEGFECRVSGFLFTAEIQQSVLRDIADRLSSTVNVETMQKTDSPKTSVTRELKMFHCLDSRNELTLLVIKLFSFGECCDRGGGSRWTTRRLRCSIL
ncbi:hypothetical protein ADEAN_000747700 [Angomonas deanei]|uniref:Uncharacterized protein n=1 Tax=Angomonas deanei TaxID=59799 RepID=A0A7G2CN17_9TRYP|nr:hypothetical protein ADEAN_000747700 [Angomonas deanei]